MSYSSKTKQILLFSAIATIAILVAYTVFFLSIMEKTRAVSILTNEIDVVVQKEVRLRSMKSLIRDIEDDRSKLNSYIVGKDAAVDFIEAIETLSDNTGAFIEITSVGIEPMYVKDEEESEIGELMRLNFTVSGSWSRVFHLLSLIESLPFNIDITRANLEQTIDSIDAEESKMWTGSFSITAVKHK